jgi:translocation and assembly module TamA
MGATALTAWPALAEEPKAAVRGEIPEDLRDAIRQGMGEAPRPPATRLEARRRARDAAEDVIAVLRSQGYYGYMVEPDVTEAEPGQPYVEVTPGPQFLLADPHIAWQGDDPPEEIQGVGVAAMQLLPGEPGRAGDIIAAEGRITAAVQKLGYADVITNPREVIVDHADHTVRPEFRITPGELVRMDGIDLKTTGRTNPEWVRTLSPWTEGDVYDPEAVAELERRLLDVGVYESVTVSLAPKEGAVNGLRPVVVSLSDRPRSTIELGAGYSTTEGIGIDGRYLRYNRFGRADTLSLLFRFAEIERRLEGELSLPHWRRAQDTLKFGGGVFQELTDAYDEVGVNAHIDLTRRKTKTTYRTFGLALDLTSTDERVPVVRQRDLATITGLGILALDRSDDPLNPKRGWRVEGRAEPTLSLGNDTSAYLRVQGQGSLYYPLGEEARTVLAGRLKIGSVVGGSLANIPAARRLYAGGGGSVRGYAYQGVGPRLPDNTPIGGLFVFEASGEVRHNFGNRWGGVVFVDIGGVSSTEMPDFSNVSAGVGAGVRYDLGFGPIRADIAVPLSKRDGDPSYQIYLSIGQSF